MNSRSSRSSRKRLTSITVVAAVVVALAGGIFLLTRDSEAAVEDAAPDVTLEFFDGSTQQLSDLQGTPVLLNFWASWCPACIAEMSDFGEVHRRLGDQVQFVGVNTQEVDLDEARSLVEQTNVDYRLAHDPDGAIFNQFGGIAMPTTVFISADGSVTQVHAGAMFAQDLIDIIEEDLLG